MDVLNARHKIRAISQDTSRAFDTVWHPALITKLSSDGIHACLLLPVMGDLSASRVAISTDSSATGFGGQVGNMAFPEKIVADSETQKLERKDFFQGIVEKVDCGGGGGGGWGF